ncbi:glycosyltransferase family 2 protein [Agaribacter marinus]|uniref:Glycosyl transferase n=1 Tax=Agaribacter marinus TaxID=1431249 RepID=A0AA37SYA9_9ALTE|nr:glycosyltransferase family 2 protein [Agaribacter marinus]GLR70031.1 glycosyl transferase [Agaribacter marinus]
MQLMPPLIRPEHIQEKLHIDLSVIVPVYNEQKVIRTFHHALCKVIAQMHNERIEVIYINDGSSDKSWEMIQALTCPFANIVRLNLSRNFGKEAAMTAGIDHANGKATVLLDADLQDPPELLPDMLKVLRNGYDVVNMKRRQRFGESFFKKFCAKQYYRLFKSLSDGQIETGVGDFRMLSERIVNHIKKMPERSRYMKGLMSWPGFKQTTLHFDRPQRVAGLSKWSFLQLIGLALSGITAFSVKPLKLATFAGALLSIFAFIYAIWVFTKTMLFGEAVAGYPTLLLIQLFLGGVQLIAIGIVGEYVGRIFLEAKARPVYLLMDSESSVANSHSRVNKHG